MHPDSYYIQALLNHDNRVIAAIYERFANRIERYVCANNGDVHDACDVFQDALMAIARQARRPDFVLTCPFEAYLYMVCRGKWLNELKRRQRAVVTIAEAAGFSDKEDAGVLADSTLWEDARDQLFLRVFEQLSAGCRQLLELAWSGISMQQVHIQLNLSYPYVRKRKSECIALLMDRIKNSPEFAALK